uniref:MARVEL domain-containing protein n=1 Tax=Steinernema glaseri TaxID=37863 RepID=A0A1I7YD54_9BILA
MDDEQPIYANGTYEPVLDKLEEDGDIEPRYGKVRLTGTLVAIGFIQIVIGVLFGVLTLAHKFPDSLYIIFLLYAGLQVVAALSLITGVYKKWPEFISFNLTCQLASVILSIIALIFTFKHQYDINYFLSAYHWMNQKTLGHIILAIYSTILIAYIIFALAAMVIVCIYQKQLLNRRGYRGSCTRCFVIGNLVFYSVFIARLIMRIY